VQSVIVVPLQRAGEAYGAIFFNHSEPGRTFTNAQIDFVTKLGTHVSLAVENAALLAGEHRVAETLQNALLAMPEAIDGVEFAELYRSSSALAKVGGDFYDLFELDDRRAGIVVGDVSGKGLEAAALNARARASLRAELSAGERTPGDVLRRINEMLYRETDAETFFTVFLGVLDRETGQLAWASGGHTTTAIVKPSGVVERLESTGPVVGAFEELEFGDGHTQLDSGDVLFAYTDGLTEARGSEDMFGEHRLFGELAARAGTSPGEMVGYVIRLAEAHATGLYDDIAMLAVRRS
jgi:phosphoserine phosphatase RsbU/P